MANDPSLAVQKALRLRLISTPAVTALVPATSILDTNQRPVPNPAIIIGEDQIVDIGLTLKRDWVRAISTVHIWKKEPSLVGIKEIAGTIRRSIDRVRRLDLDDPDFVCSDCKIVGATFMRDPDGETSHGVVKIESLVQQRWSVTI